MLQENEPLASASAPLAPAALPGASLPVASPEGSGDAPRRTGPPPLPALGRADPNREPVTKRSFVCRCGQPVFFRNSRCLACDRSLGYDAQRGEVLALEPAAEPMWQEAEAGANSRLYRRCRHLHTESHCNWLVDPEDSFAGEPPMCRCCRLTRTLPDLSIANHALWWRRIEVAKRRLVSTLIQLKLPVLSRTGEDLQRGLAFDLLRSPPHGPKVVTGHDDGIITLDIEEADDATREQRRGMLHEPYRTLLGHLRHEVGHYYWQRLVDGTHWIEPYRALFGDERENYGAALARHYANGPRPDWGTLFVSAYASSHPWEDWAETWAHYLHLLDTLDTANSFGLDGERVELSYEPYTVETLGVTDDPQPEVFLSLLNGWMELTGVLNELSRAMGMQDFYPFVMSAPAVCKLHLVHRIVRAEREARSASGGASDGTSPAS